MKKVVKKVKITVLKKEFYAEYADKYLAEGIAAGACPEFEVGDEFIYEGSAKMPEGFCPWAWIDVYRGVSALYNGAAVPEWYRRGDTQVLCCSDGVRPVVFLLEAMD